MANEISQLFINNTLYDIKDEEARINPITLCSWSTGTDEEIVAAVNALDSGTITTDDLMWEVGDERVISLSAMSTSGTSPQVGESHVAQDVTFVILNKGGKLLEDGITECNYIVGLKNFLTNGSNAEGGYISGNYTLEKGWEDCTRRKWCNSIFCNSLPSDFAALFKNFINLTGSGGNSSSPTIEETIDKFALASEIEVFGATSYSATGEGSQFEYYKTSANRVKKRGDSSSATAWNWWERSPQIGFYSYSTSYNFCYVSASGAPQATQAYSTYGIAPFGVI